MAVVAHACQELSMWDCLMRSASNSLRALLAAWGLCSWMS